MGQLIPNRVPGLGFYYHYKHNPQGLVNNYAYEVLGIGFQTEDKARAGEGHFVIYRALYESSTIAAAAELGVPCFYARPLSMWLEDVVREGKKVPRFTLITDPQIILALERIRGIMY